MEGGAACSLESRGAARRLGVFLACLAATVALGCERGDVEPWDASAPLSDPMAVAADALAPANGFDGVGSLALGAGWGIPEGDGGAGPWGSYAWVVGAEALVHARLARPAGEVDFFARCLPYPWEAGSPVQTLTLEAARGPIARVEMALDWADYRLPLPASLPRESLLDLRLRFDHALRPADDGRELAAACTELAVVPRRVGDVGSFLAAQSFDPARGRVALPVGGGLRLPLPPARRARVRLADVRLGCGSCRLVLELDEPGSPSRRLATVESGRPRLEAAFAGPDGRSSLTLRVESTQAGGGGGVAFRLEEVAVRRRRRPAPASPSVFVYAVDTLRADALDGGLDGSSPMPAARALAARGLSYSQARAPSSWTLPSVASLFTGLYPDLHGVRTGGEGRSLDGLPTLARALGRRGYRTVAISQSSVVSPTYGFDAGFEAFYVSDQLNGLALRSQEARGLLAHWLAGGDGRRPELVYLHTVDPHAPYSPPEMGPAGRPDLVAARGPSRSELGRWRELYAAEVRHADRELGRFLALLEWLDVFDSSFVVLLADHGEELGEHGGLEHGKTLYDEVLRVPLVVKHPGGRWAGQRVDEPVSLVDLAPTFLAAASVPALDLDGRRLPVPGDGSRPSSVYFEVAPHRDPGVPAIDLRGWSDGRGKCIEDRSGAAGGAPVVAFDLARDPGERRPLGAGTPEAKRCRERMEARDRSRLAAGGPSADRPAEPDPLALERLRSLGYLD